LSVPSGSASSGVTRSRTFAELLIDCEEDRTLRTVLVGMLREMERYEARAFAWASNSSKA
jgi:hypothetical protein